MTKDLGDPASKYPFFFSFFHSFFFIYLYFSFFLLYLSLFLSSFFFLSFSLIFDCLSIFFDEFYGEGIQVNAGARMERAATEFPYAGIAWCGHGSINGNRIDASDNSAKEFLVVPNTLVFVECNSEVPLCIFILLFLILLFSLLLL